MKLNGDQKFFFKLFCVYFNIFTVIIYTIILLLKREFDWKTFLLSIIYSSIICLIMSIFMIICIWFDENFK